MRVLGRLRTDDRGISGVLVAISMVALFGAAVISVDAGALWANKRNMTTATDASALAEAQTLAKNPSPGASSCTSTWLNVLNANVSDLSGAPACSLSSMSGDGTSGVVMVQGRKRSAAFFSGIFGMGDGAAFSATATQFGSALAVSGIRPIALCTYDPEVQDALLLHGVTTESHIPGSPAANYWAPDNSQDYAEAKGHGPASAPVINGTSVGVVHHIAFTSTCNGAPGNFGWIDLNSDGASHSPPENCQGGCTNNNSNETADWLKNGYYGNLVGVTAPTDCDTSAPGTQGCTGDPGVSNSSTIRNALDYLLNPTSPGNCRPGAGGTCKPLAVPVILYDGVGGGGGGATFHLIGVAFVKIFDYGLSNSNRFLDLEFTNGIFEGTCCARDAGAGSGNAPFAPAIRICATDHDPADPNLTALRCTFS